MRTETQEHSAVVPAVSEETADFGSPTTSDRP
jgi:hypothetical protein